MCGDSECLILGALHSNELVRSSRLTSRTDPTRSSLLVSKFLIPDDWVLKGGFMNDRNSQRVLNRRGARELTQQEAERTSGGHRSFILTLSGMPSATDDS